jgi:hypothetical protein
MMSTAPRNTLVYVWLFLVAVTLVSGWLGTRFGRTPVQMTWPVSCAVLLIALVKSRLVFRHFMDVRLAPAWLGWTCDAWLVFVFGMIFAIGASSL